MKFKKPKFWDYEKPNVSAYLLWPTSVVIKLVNYLRAKIKNKKKYSSIKTICVGNIYLGGTGKTSLCLKINELLNKANIRSCFIKKYYKDQLDEQKILENSGKLFKYKKRINSTKAAINENYKIAIFDDGLQDLSLNYDLEFVCFNNINWIGNGLTIPSGPLRENLEKLKKYNNVFLIGNGENTENIKSYILNIDPNINIYEANYIPLNINEFEKKEKYLAFSGIGNHKTFISMLKINGLEIVKDLEFPDHYDYSKNDIEKINDISKNLNCNIITTEKDFIRLDANQIQEIKFIKSELKIINEEKFFKAISKLYE
ncbi:tetraacyldisaccharide 4'-kinase [Candidatus Pelagibacter sp.]|nr:tetraacyldisaccharide 4'-kinase [Candidatus Pelagibacter sp.]